MPREIEPTRSVLITGAAGVLGRAVATEMTRRAWTVIGVDITQGPHVSAILDLSSDDELSTLETLVKRRSVDGAIFCHGHLGRLELLSTTSEEISLTLNNNLMSTIKVAKLLLLLNPEAFKIVHVGSLAAETGATDPIYAASKAACRAFVLSLARSHLNCRCCVIEPGPFESQMNTSKGNSLKYLSRSPIGRLITPHEVAQVICSAWECAEALNGSVIPVDGGIRIS